MESFEIATRLEADHPTPSLHLDTPGLSQLQDDLLEAREALKAVFMPLVPVRLLTEKSIPYFTATREKAVGMPLDQFHRENGGPKAWEAARKPLSKIAALLEEKEGPFFLGKTVSYADFVLAGFLLFYKRIGEDILAEVLKSSGDGKAFAALLEAVRPWSERASY